MDVGDRVQRLVWKRYNRLLRCMPSHMSDMIRTAVVADHD